MAFGQTPTFGQPSSGFSFGQSAATPTPFGASSTPTFGASSTPAFGAPSTPAFGAPAASTPSLFGASSTPAFGAASTPAFGVSPSPFGTPSTPAFGTPGSTPSLFGASSAAASSSTGTFSFSFPAASSAAPTTGSAFRSFFPATTSTSAPAPSTGLFGQQPATGGGFFGALTTTQQPQQQPGTQLSPLAYSTGSHEQVKWELEAVATAYMPNHPSFKFQHLFLSVVDNPAQRVKPPRVLDELSWKQALRDAGGPDNPDRLWPVVASGFHDLLTRGQAQATALEDNRQRLDQLRDVAHKLAQRQATEIASRVAAARQKHVELSNRLLAVARHVDALEGRLANFVGIRSDLSRGKEVVLSRALEVVEAQLSPTSPAGLQRRLDALAAACRLRAHSGIGMQTDGTPRLDEASLQQLFSVLKEHVEGVKQLQEVLRRDVLDVEIMRGVRQDGSVVPAAMNFAAVEYI
eukprot:GHUV01003371.1.p1 GENE.GHUV01003371.1~~GHUV01003371.1.p1  ORF type:complete len:463 (+),score=140.84 GHUV01003371.1:198-1586(+)